MTSPVEMRDKSISRRAGAIRATASFELLLGYTERIGAFAVELAEHFWLSLATSARCNLHVELLYGRNQHHILEAGFKAVARALSAAVRRDPRVSGVPSTKGAL